MSHDNNDLHVPNLGPADRSPATLKVDVSEKIIHSEQSASHTVAQTGNGGGWFTTLILVLLTAACSGLGYLGFGLQQTIIEQQQTVSNAAERISELERMLNVASDSAVQTGQTLEQRLLQVNQDATEKYSFYDSEIAKLWDVANKRNKNSIDALSAELKDLTEHVSKSDQTTIAANSVLVKGQQEQTKLLATFEQKVAQVATLATQAAAVDKKLTELINANSQLSKDQAALKSSDAENLKSLRQSISSLQTQIAIFEETLGEKQSNQQASLNKIVSRLSAVEKSSRSGGGNIEARVKANEQAIRAIDGTRRQTNSDILFLTNKLNALQLKVNRL
ncbi:hypothetical protein [Neptunomonas qingdaonensis]|uniref:Uncharacterized protein n=1 Tax=Neptunomonas qingdaonensis TaxID=1045558 RepID=A0A1I2NNG4_9GAMM|nr:hypothetical protein [Neptunomonas qingdaonensis]SFG05103.1 hypothetical protein SAMN05216175_10319 [Neptunomonas qingdaonensis]